MLARVFLNGFTGIPEGNWWFFPASPAFVKVLRRVPSSSVLDPAPSDSAPKGSSGDSSSELSGDAASGGGEVGRLREESYNPSGMPCWCSESAEWGEMIRTVLTILVL